MKSQEVRDAFIDFFKNKYNHSFVPSSSLILPEDPTLLFANAGMNQFKDIFLNRKQPEVKRAVNSQRCIRVSGKHNDLEEVGRDTYHHTFFEMLGNWSFNDYYKTEAIMWGWELLTEVWKIPKERLHATVFAGDKEKNLDPDTESFEIWKNKTDIAENNIHYCGAKDNFWMMGATGPCGPCSEIHIDLTPDISGRDLINKDSPLVIELWNLVFIQYNSDENGVLTPLSHKHIDTGMGFERICAVLQQKMSNYDTDIFAPYINAISNLTSTKYTASMDSYTDIAIRVLSDHIRMSSFAISDGAIPDNKGRGYVIRGIIRRMVRYYYQHLNCRDPFAYKLVSIVIEQLGNVYPSIVKNSTKITEIIKEEEQEFLKTIDKGMSIFNDAVKKAGTNNGLISGETIFNLYTTYGFPADLTRQMAEEHKLTIDENKFKILMEEHKAISGAKNKFKTAVTIKGDLPATDDAEKYKRTEMDTAIKGWIINNEYIADGKLDDGGEVILLLDKTCFYAESGGQPGDTGSITTDTGSMKVTNTLKVGNSIYHIGTIENGYFSQNQSAKIAVDDNRSLNSRNHTCTHLLHYSLQKIAGDSIEQQGSKIKPDSFTFDFLSKKPITPKQINAIEQLVNDMIGCNYPVVIREMQTAEAKKLDNVKAFFGDKYGSVVRVVDIGENMSREFCGGTHVKNTGDIGNFLIVKEEGIAKGIRRVTCVTGKPALDIVQNNRGILDSLCKKFRCQYGEIMDNVQANDKKIKELESQLSKLTLKDTIQEVNELYEKSPAEKDVRIVTGRIKNNFKNNIWEALTSFTGNNTNVVFVIGNVQGSENVELISMASKDLKDKGIDCKKIIAESCPIINGGGGGSQFKARGGGSDPAKLDAALKHAHELIINDLKA